MNAQRLTTLSSRSLIGFSGAFLVHGSLEEYWMSGFWLHVGTFIAAVILCFCCEYNPRDNSKGERLKADRANWMQIQAIAIGLCCIAGGLVIWLS